MHRVAFFLCSVWLVGCTIIPGKPTRDESLSPERPRREVTFAGVAGYATIGVVRDAVDTPFTLFHRFHYYLTPDEKGFLGFKVGGDSLIIVIIKSLIPGYLAGNGYYYAKGGSISGLFSGGAHYWHSVAFGVATAVALAVYPFTVSPVENFLCRYPYEEKSANRDSFWRRYFLKGYVELKESPHYDYFPNFALFFPYREREASGPGSPGTAAEVEGEAAE